MWAAASPSSTKSTKDHRFRCCPWCWALVCVAFALGRPLHEQHTHLLQTMAHQSQRSSGRRAQAAAATAIAPFPLPTALSALSAHFFPQLQREGGQRSSLGATHSTHPPAPPSSLPKSQGVDHPHRSCLYGIHTAHGLCAPSSCPLPKRQPNWAGEKKRGAGACAGREPFRRGPRGPAACW